MLTVDDKSDVLSMAQVIEIVPIDIADNDMCCPVVEVKHEDLPVTDLNTDYENDIEDLDLVDYAPDIIGPVLIVKEEVWRDLEVEVAVKSDTQHANRSEFCGAPDFIYPAVELKSKEDIKGDIADGNEDRKSNHSDIYCTQEFKCPTDEVKDVIIIIIIIII